MLANNIFLNVEEDVTSSSRTKNSGGAESPPLSVRLPIKIKPPAGDQSKKKPPAGVAEGLGK